MTQWTPILCHSEIRDSFKEIVYELPNKNGIYIGNKIRILSEVNFIDHRNDGLNNFYPYSNTNILTKNYAYGILINPYKTRLLVLDFDAATYEEILEIANKLIGLNEVLRVDIIRSSVNKGRKNWHIHASLKDYYNILNMYLKDIPYSCKAFNEYVTDTEEIILRVSQKFSKAIPKDEFLEITAPRYFPTHCKLEKLSLADVIKPGIFSDFEDNEEQELKENVHRIKIRRRKSEDFISKTKGSKVATDSSIKNFEMFSRALS